MDFNQRGGVSLVPYLPGTHVEPGCGRFRPTPRRLYIPGGHKRGAVLQEFAGYQGHD